ncbi:predicted protein [Naegleria gruberi]|uniref:Predicted protein n=1 Tax=Naegleria gruberi TaxID=5762 RepID=D2VRB2_NAEGR|nr:uncharacterized protein NAEGRDRAFT_71524 [Naegleria gruberi]EFC40577.1 predicted protein [Naegleria gruberi]|eukprot:XP_002673321.1 predicted protein [Naegleria gruberi strain NEG-M]
MFKSRKENTSRHSDEYFQNDDERHVFEIYVPMLDENMFGGLPTLFDKETYPLTYLGLPKTAKNSNMNEDGFVMNNNNNNNMDVAQQQSGEGSVKFIFNHSAFENSCTLGIPNNVNLKTILTSEEEQVELLRQIVFENIKQHEWRYCITNINAGISHSFPCPGKVGSALTFAPFTCGLSILPIFLLSNYYISEAMRRINMYLGKVNKSLLDRAKEKNLDFYLHFQVVRQEKSGISWVQVNALATRGSEAESRLSFSNEHVIAQRQLIDEDEEDMQSIELK